MMDQTVNHKYKIIRPKRKRTKRYEIEALKKKINGLMLNCMKKVDEIEILKRKI